MLNENIKKYNELQGQLDAIENEMAMLKESIMSEMDDEKLDKITTKDGLVAQIVSKETFKYKDEQAMLMYLKSKGLNQFIVEKVNTTAMNKELKKGMSLTEDMNSMYTKMTSRAFSVKKA